MNVWNTFLDEYQRWPLWIPVLIGVGVGLYFALPNEPPTYWALCPLLTMPGLYLENRLRLPLLLIFFIILGFSAAIIRTATLPVQMLEQEIGPLWLEGHVDLLEEKISPSGTLSYRAVLSDINAISDEKIPEKARITLRGALPKLQPGERIRLRAVLLPLSGPTHPGGFDFRRHNYFKGIEATGYNISPPRVVSSPPMHSLWVQLEILRQYLTSIVKTQLPAPQGGIAAALITGDRSGISDITREIFANSGLAHILAISGLHLSIVAGLVFIIVRRGGALIPNLSVCLDTKKIAAFITLVITLFYLAISGFGIPAQRAFLMTTLAMTAIFLNRNPLSLRAVAFAATLILLLRPENLLTPSFQLSFAAVIGLISAYETWHNPIERWLYLGGVFRKFFAYFGGVAFTSLIATLSTLPFIIMTFNQFTLVSIFANMAAVPLTAFLIMPSALAVVLSLPFGLEPWFMPILNLSLTLLYDIAKYCAYLPGAQIKVPSPSILSFLLVIFGGLWICLWSRTWRLWGFAPLALGAFLIPFTPRPHIFIDSQGKLVGFYHHPHRLLVTSMRRGKFPREMWLRNLGEEEASLLPCEFTSCHYDIDNKRIIVVNQPCDLEQDGTLIINLSEQPCPLQRACISRAHLREHGAHSVFVNANGTLQIQKTYKKQRF